MLPTTSAPLLLSRTRWALPVLAAAGLAISTVLVGGAPAGAATAAAAAPGNGPSSYPSISDDGRYIAFASEASNLVSGDTNGRSDIFVRDLTAGTTRLVSRSSGNTLGNGSSVKPVISADGRFVAFESAASNLVGRDTNGKRDVFVRDLSATTTVRISVSTAGGQGNDGSYLPSISRDGRYLAFESDATNLVSGDTNGVRDIFLRDRTLNRTVRVNIAANQAQSNGTSYSASVSPDGTKVAFRSNASNLDPNSPPPNNPGNVYLRDRANNVTIRNQELDRYPYSGDVYNYVTFGPVMSPDNQTVLFGYNYGVDADHGTLILWSPLGPGYDERIRTGDGYELQTDGDFNGNGTKVGYNDDYGDGMHRLDLATHATVAASPAVRGATNVSLSGTGRYLAFDAYDSLVSRDDNGLTDIYVYDFRTSTYSLVS
jgi:hypothetical protein